MLPALQLEELRLGTTFAYIGCSSCIWLLLLGWLGFLLILRKVLGLGGPRYRSKHLAKRTSFLEILRQLCGLPSLIRGHTLLLQSSGIIKGVS